MRRVGVTCFRGVQRASLNLPCPVCPGALAAAERSVAEYKERLPQNVVDSINAAVAELRGVMESENAEVVSLGLPACLMSVCCWQGSFWGLGRLGLSAGAFYLQQVCEAPRLRCVALP